MSSTLGATHRSMKSASPEIRQHCRKRGTAATAASNASIRDQVLAVELDQHEGRYLIAQQPLVERGADRLDNAAAAQRADPAQAGRGRDADPLRELVDPDPAVPLQFGEDPQVDVIELWAFCPSRTGHRGPRAVAAAAELTDCGMRRNARQH